MIDAGTSRRSPPFGPLRLEQIERMNEAAFRTPGNERHSASLTQGALLAGCLALVFGVFLWTVLDATRPSASKANNARAAALSVFTLN
jgi:hypothetical protein